MSAPISDIRKQYTANFKKERDRLNKGQQEAVSSIEGPVLVLAGPGTGKTHILSARIGHILLETDTQPHNILCLTYTDAGVTAMRQRLLHFIGPESHKVHIYTFHSFCNHVIQQNLSTFGIRELEPLSDLESVEVIREILEGLPMGHPLKNLKGDPYLYEGQLRDLFTKMKAENWSPDLVDQQIEIYLDKLPFNPEFQYKVRYRGKMPGDPKDAKIKLETERMARLSAGAYLFDSYEKALRDRQRYDFADMIRWVGQMFNDDIDLLRNYQEQYLYILVDEFQDTNGAQMGILSQLLDYWDRPNIFVVGDDDQSIFEFQGARVRNIAEFYRNYDDVKLVLLTENYRSSQVILDTANSLIVNNQLRLIHNLDVKGLNKDLLAANGEVANLRTRPLIKAYHNTLHEDADIVQTLKKWQGEGRKMSDVAIIYARHKQARNITDLLDRNGIPYSSKRRVNILELPIIRNILDLLRYLRKEFERPFSGEEQLYRILHFNFVGIDPMDVAKLAMYLHRLRFVQGKQLTWRELIGDEPILETLDLHKPKAVQHLSKLIEGLLSDYVNLPFPVLFERLMNHSGLVVHLTQSPEKVWLVQIVSTFFNFIKKEAQKNPAIRLGKFLDIIDRMNDNRIDLGIHKTQYADDHGVNLVTAHSAKGLEFDAVFIIDCVKEYWEPGNRSGRGRFSFPETLTFSGAEDALEASRRLFYVAMTRAKSYLQISYGKNTLTGKERQQSRFIDEITYATALDIEPAYLENADLMEAQLQLITSPPKPVLLSPLSTAHLNGLLENFVLSPTSLCRYIDCPLSFYFENVLRIPSASSEAAAYGSAVHYALRRLFEKRDAGPEKNFPEKEEFLDDFYRELDRQKLFFTPVRYRQRRDRGTMVLPEYYDARINNWDKETSVELGVRNVEVEGVPLTGTVDKIEFTDKHKLHIVDYKTSKHRPEQLKRPSADNPVGGDYWRQLVFYKLLLENYQGKDWKVVSGEIDYVEPDKKTGAFKQVSFTFTKEETDIVRKQIKDTYTKIMNHELFTGCGKDYCKWCNFANEHLEIASFRDELAEELDD